MTKRYALSGAGLIRHKAYGAKRMTTRIAAPRDSDSGIGKAGHAAGRAAYYEYGYGLDDVCEPAERPVRRHTCMFMMS